MANILIGIAFIVMPTFSYLHLKVSINIVDALLTVYVRLSILLFGMFPPFYVLLLITTERLVAVLYPLRLQFWIIKMRVKICAIVAWIISTLLAVSPFYGFKSLKVMAFIRSYKARITLILTSSIVVVVVGMLMFLTHGSSEGRFVSQCHHVCRNCSSGLLPWRTNMQFEQCARAHRRGHIDYTSQFKPTVYSNYNTVTLLC